MYPVSNAFLTAIQNEEVQHLKCTIRELSGTEHILGYGVEGDEITGSPVINRQCVEDTDNFAFGQLYVGTVEITVSMTDIDEDALADGELELEFGIDVGSTEPEWVPLGIWDISEVVCEAKSGDTKLLKITALDKLERLKCRSYTGISVLYLDTIMEIIEEYAGVEFAQTPAQILALIQKPRGRMFRAQMAETCWDEVRQISQLIGGFACTDRQGRIVFRKFGQTPVLTVQADKRFSAKISEYSSGINAITYTSEGYSYTVYPGYSDHGVAISFSENGYIFDFHGDDVDEDDGHDYVTVFYSWLYPVQQNLNGLKWYPGTVNYYGNPALDLGDMIYIADGVAGERKKFLICAETWQFRAPQTLISPGCLGESGTSSGSSGSSSVISVPTTNIRVEKAINTVELEKLTGTLYEAERTVARGSYSCKGNTCCFVNVGLVLLADEDGTAGAVVYNDEVAQDFRPMLDLHAGEYSTLSFTVPISAPTGEHSIRVTAYGSAELTAISAHIWGQEITGKSPEYTSASDYTYTIEDGAATVTGYLGDSLYPEIPPRFEGAPTAVIGAQAFTDSDITAVYIPEGVTEIQSLSGSLPAEYQQVEYLASTGTQYIDTGLQFGGNYSYEVDCELDNEDGNQMFGMKYWYDHCIYVWSNKCYAKGGQYSPSQNGYDTGLTGGTRAVYSFSRPDKSLEITSENVHRSYTFSDFSPESSVYHVVLFACWTSWSDTLSNYGKGKIYGFRFWLNGELISEMIPCYRKADSKPGMYDTVRQRFYTNSGTGEFTYGEDAGEATGAFMNAYSLSSVYIPRSCEIIGEWAFTNTALTKVRIPADCTYYETSFPNGCEVQFYGGGGDYAQLYDSDEYALIDSEGALIYAKE